MKLDKTDRRILDLLQRDAELREVASVVGPEALEDRDRLLLAAASAAREYVHDTTQSTFLYCPALTRAHAVWNATTDEVHAVSRFHAAPRSPSAPDRNAEFPTPIWSGKNE